ncbi:MAG: threonine synthase [Terriglobales bacterium]
MHLRCISCAATFDLHERLLACRGCGDLLEVVTNGVTIDPADLKHLWLERRMSNSARNRSGVWRFREFLPDYSEQQVVTMGEGNVPLVRGNKTAEWVGIKNLSFKHLGWNPTGSFKDLGMTVGMTEAKHVGAKAVGCASTGNTSASMAAYAARAGVKAKVYLPAGKLSHNKLAQALDFGAEIIQVEGSFDRALDTMLESGEDVYFLNSINPFRLEGQKTAMFELFEQLNWHAPDYVVVPGGNLGNSSSFGKAFDELIAAGLIEKAPRLVVVQAAGANPFSKLYQTGANELTPTEHPETVATAIRIGNPRSWKKALRAVQNSGGFVMDVTDDEIAEAKAMIGRDGIGCEPASAATLAGLRKLTSANKLDREASVVAILTGHALKDTDFIISSQQRIEKEALAEVRS